MSSSDQFRDLMKSPMWAAKREQAFAVYGRKCERCGKEHPDMYVFIRSFGQAIEDIPVTGLAVLCRTCFSREYDKRKQAYRLARKNKAHKQQPCSSQKLQERVFNSDAATYRLVALLLDHSGTDSNA